MYAFLFSGSARQGSKAGKYWRFEHMMRQGDAQCAPTHCHDSPTADPLYRCDSPQEEEGKSTRAQCPISWEPLSMAALEEGAARMKRKAAWRWRGAYLTPVIRHLD
jgi:hypothetical protein